MSAEGRGNQRTGRSQTPLHLLLTLPLAYPFPPPRREDFLLNEEGEGSTGTENSNGYRTAKRRQKGSRRIKTVEARNEHHQEKESKKEKEMLLILPAFSSLSISVSLFVFKFIFGQAVQHGGSWFHNQGSNPCPLHWEHRILAPGPLEKFFSFSVDTIKSREVDFFCSKSPLGKS